MNTDTKYNPMNDPKQNRRLVVSRILKDLRDDAGQTSERQWLRLTAAHIVGQNDLLLHFQVHGAMLGHALRTRDWPEAAGQLLRLALVPLGHLLDRLPAGNIGRATVSAFEPMAVSPELEELISSYRLT